MKKYLLFVILFFLLIYLAMPVLNYGFYSVGVIVLVLLFFLFLFSLGISTDKAGKKFIVNQKPKKWILLAMAVVLGYVTVLPLITSATFLYTSKYQKMIGEVMKRNEIYKNILSEIQASGSTSAITEFRSAISTYNSRWPSQLSELEKLWAE